MDELSHGDDHQKGNGSSKARFHEDLNILSFEIEYKNAALSRGT
jgi:hypothetical protein